MFWKVVNGMRSIYYTERERESEGGREKEKINFPPHKISEIRLFRVGKNGKKKKHTTIN
jgi:hypothetical protein